MKIPRTFPAAALALASLCLGAASQPPAPSAPAQYQVVLRYQIPSARDQHVIEFDAMIEQLRQLGFLFNPPLADNPETDREDRSKNYLRGTIASAKFPRVLGTPGVASLLVMPEDFAFPPTELDKIVHVRLELSGGLGAERQRELADEVKAILAVLDFREAVGYDHHGYSGRPFTRLVGTIPEGRLEVLLKDLRGQPGGWFTPRVAPGDLPSPLRNVQPIRIVEVLPDTAPVATIPPPQPRMAAYLDKISSDLWALLNDKTREGDTVRVELLFVGLPAADNQGGSRALEEAAPGIFVEGQLGQVTSAVVRAGQIKSLAQLPMISTIRLQRPVRVDVNPALALPGDNNKALALTGLADLHKRGYRGQGVRVAILDTDFRGWDDLVKKGELPAATRLVDLTPLFDPDLQPAPLAGNPGQLGHGTVCARAAALAAPQADLVLVRMDASSPYQMDDVVRFIRGTSNASPYVDRRRDELVTARAELNLLRAQVELERRIILEDYTDEVDLRKDFGFLGPVYGWVFSPRAWSRDQVAYVDKLDKALNERKRRFFDVIEAIRSLAGITVAASPLVWNDGYALGAASPLSRALEGELSTSPGKGPPLLWFQSAANTRGQTWTGLFHDEDGNGIMEFAPPGHKLKKGQWTSEINFLAWKPFAADETPELPAGTRLRVSLQWREPHDADYYARGAEADLYGKPLADLRLSLLRQRDPHLKTLPADAFELAAVTSGMPERLEHQPGGSIYEVVLETTLDKPGRYALRVERPVGRHWFVAQEAGQHRLTFAKTEALQPSGLRPLGVVTLPALEKQWELQPRLFVDVVGPERLQGRPVLADFATDQGSVGLPGDARPVITVGAADWQNRPRSYSAGGPLAFAALARKPTILAYDALTLGPAGSGAAFGTSVATSFAAGTTAAFLSAGMSPAAALNYLNQQNGNVLKVPRQ